MSTTPPEEPGGYGAPPNVNFNLNALMPTPGNAEFDVGGWVTSFTAITIAYLISRGIAKASRVLER